MEKFFFDQLFYKKSPIHGYSKFVPIISKDNSIIEKRRKDLHAIYATQKSNVSVLGSKTEDPYSIALIGDSMIYGLGVRENQSVGRILEKKLNKIRPTKVYVMAMPGDSIVENYAKFLAAYNTSKINLYIVALYHNDTIYDHANRYPNESDVYRHLVNLCPNPEFIPNENWGKIEWERLVYDVLIPSYSPLFANRCWLEKAVISMANKTDMLMFFLLDLEIGEIYGNDSKSPDNMFNHVVALGRNTVTAAGGSTISGFGIRPSENFQYVSKKEFHPSAETHRLYAERLFQEITNNPKWGLSKPTD